MANYFVKSTMADQGAARAEDDFVCGPESLKEIIDWIGTTNQATIVLESKNTGQTTYTVTTAESVPSNIKVRIWAGAVISGTLTFDNTDQILAGDYQIFSSATISFTNGGTYIPAWWGAVGDGTTDDSTAVQAVLDSFESSSGTLTFGGGKTYLIGTSLTFNPSNNLVDGNLFEGYGSILKSGLSTST